MILADYMNAQLNKLNLNSMFLDIKTINVGLWVYLEANDVKIKTPTIFWDTFPFRQSSNLTRKSS